MRDNGKGTHESWPAFCFVTAAAMPPVALAFFLSFFEPETMVKRCAARERGCDAARGTYWAFKQFGVVQGAAGVTTVPFCQ